MTYHFSLSESERLLMQELLENERRELHPEVRRSTMSLEAHEDLQRRLRMVEELIQRVRQAETAMA